nr:MAG TPA: Head protein [Caudoviricetes sp.]
MPVKPKIRTLTTSAADILNVIRNNASVDYRNYVPKADANDVESVRTIGAIIMDYPALQNEFLNALVNRIGRVMLTSKMYSNPIAFFKKGVLEYGESIEEIFVNIAKVQEFNPEIAEQEVFKRVVPDVRAAFHIMNYQKFYKATVTQEQLKQAFLSWDGVTDLIARIVDSMYTGANYDEFLVMKYLLARHILDGRVYPVTVPTVNAENAKAIVTTVKGVSNKLTFMNSEYNPAAVRTFTEKTDQYMIVNSVFDATMDVNVLASAFNMDKAEFLGHRVLIDGFGDLDIARLGEIFAGDPTYHEPSHDELIALNAIPAVIVDKDWFMVFDMLTQFTEQYNGQGLYWNYFYHVWKTFSVSPFANSVLFVPGTPSVTSVTVSPTTASVPKGGSVSLSCVVVTEYFAPQTVVWTSNAADVKVSAAGVVTVDADATSTTATITATSAFDDTKKATCTVTVK